MYFKYNSLNSFILYNMSGDRSLSETKNACTFCSKSFRYNSQLIRHLRIHTGERPFVCDICQKGFVEPIALERHYRTHTGEKPYKCKLCNYCAGQRGNLIYHEKKKHPWKNKKDF